MAAKKRDLESISIIGHIFKGALVHSNCRAPCVMQQQIVSLLCHPSSQGKYNKYNITTLTGVLL